MSAVVIQRMLLAMAMVVQFAGVAGEMEFGRESMRDGSVQRKRIHGGLGAVATSKPTFHFDKK